MGNFSSFSACWLKTHLSGDGSGPRQGRRRCFLDAVAMTGRGRGGRIPGPGTRAGCQGHPCLVFPSEAPAGAGPVLQPRGRGSRSRAFLRALHPAGPHRRLRSALGFPRCLQLCFLPAPGALQNVLAVPHSHPDQRLQLVRGVHVTQLIWGWQVSLVAPWEWGQSKPHPSLLIFVPRETKRRHTMRWRAFCREVTADCRATLGAA